MIVFDASTARSLPRTVVSKRRTCAEPGAATTARFDSVATPPLKTTRLPPPSVTTSPPPVDTLA